MSQAIGHLDFYPNGGEEMPGCDKNLISQIVDIDGIWEGEKKNVNFYFIIIIYINITLFFIINYIS